MATLHITHNHGTITLADFTTDTVEAEGYNGHRYEDTIVTGMPIDGGWFSRLLHVTAFREIDKSKPYSTRLYGRALRPSDQAGHYTVDVSFCG